MKAGCTSAANLTEESRSINRVQSGSWQGRCAGAGLRQNLGPNWGPLAWMDVTGSQPNAIFASTSLKRSEVVEKCRKRKCTDSAKKVRREAKRRASEDSNQGRSDYSRHDGGRNADDVNSDLPPDYLKELMTTFYDTHVKADRQKAEEIETLTRSQGFDESSAHIWMAERRKRITASTVGRIAKRRPSTKVANAVKQHLYSTFRGNAATRWGHLQEPRARSRYTQRLLQESPNIKVHTSGLVVSSTHSWLGASPDGLVTDPHEESAEGVVELKNPYNARNMTISEAVDKVKDFCLSQHEHGHIALKKSDPYYYQVQATMFCTKRNWCDFVVNTSQDLHIERIRFNEQFWAKVMPKLKSFYFDAILPELACPRYHHGGIREPSEWK